MNPTKNQRYRIQNTTQKTNDWATRTTLKTQDKEHKLLHRNQKIGQYEPN